MLQDHHGRGIRIIQEILNIKYMASLNKIFLIGRVGKDPEIRTFDNGNKLATFTLATSESYTDRNGQRQEQTEWHSIVLNGRLADVAAQFIRKGSNVYIEGKIRTRSWDDQNGQKHYQTEIVGLGLQLLDPKPQAQPQQGGFSQPTYSAQPQRPSAQHQAAPQPQTPPQPAYNPPYGAVAQPPQTQRRVDPLDPANYPNDMPFI